MPAEELSRDEIDSILREATVGTLSMADGGDTYAVPQSFGYDGEDLYFQLVSHKESRKIAYLETTDRITLTVIVEDPWRSVIVQGPLRKVPDEDQQIAANAIAENATIPTLNVSIETPLEELATDFYQLEPETLSGRRFLGAAGVGAKE
jgi:nitroimidazol reductase NimA-like FMN-containing flavoprotein (pyridoxamine 5'-phosphate oxidase superfamily)